MVVIFFLGLYIFRDLKIDQSTSTNATKLFFPKQIELSNMCRTVFLLKLEWCSLGGDQNIS